MEKIVKTRYRLPHCFYSWSSALKRFSVNQEYQCRTQHTKVTCHTAFSKSAIGRQTQRIYLSLQDVNANPNHQEYQAFVIRGLT